MYSRGEYSSLPATTADLSTIYSSDEWDDINTDDTSYVAASADEDKYAIHMFKEYVGTDTKADIYWTGQSSKAPSVSRVYLQVYDSASSVWLTLDSDHHTAAGTDFTLGRAGLDISTYKDVSSILRLRVFQRN